MSVSKDNILTRAATLNERGIPFALVTVVRAVSPTSAKPGAKALVQADGVIHGWIGGGCAQPAVIKSARQALADGEARLIRISPNKSGNVEEGIVDFGMTCHSGGTLDIFVEPILEQPLLLLLGGSPVAQSLAELASRVGFEVGVACAGATSESFPDASKLYSDFQLDRQADLRPSFIVVATQGKRDQAALEAALNTSAAYIAFVASDRKTSKLRESLVERGFGAERVAVIRAPAGVDIGAKTPAEIALSVLADVVRARRTEAMVSAGSAAINPEAYSVRGCCGTPIDANAVTANGASVAIDPVCGMSVTRSEAEDAYEFGGETYYFCCSGCQRAFANAPADYLVEGADR